MTSQDQSYLRFSLEETVWFDKGQEIEELYSISLDPQIQMEEQNQFIRMHGYLELSGEYQPAKAANEEPERQPLKYVQHVLERSENECEFFHQFPIDITIPKNRIEKMEDVEIYIDSFDYELPEKAHLRLTVDLSISGIYGEQQTQRAQETASPQPEDEPEETIVQKEEEPAVEPEFSMLKLEVDHSSEEETSGDEAADFSVEVKRQPAEEDKEVGAQLLQAIQRRKEKKERKELDPQAVVELEQVEPPLELELKLEDDSEETAEAMADLQGEEAEETLPEEEEPKKKKSFSLQKTETMSLADFFARKEQEEAVTWKVCLVQKDDTLQTLAERYEISVSEIIRENKLETNQTIEEGQVLYIPYKQTANQ
ncbi:stage VI sporulation protein D [Bacillus xiapuensis]|uniref:stage VI sporulation protein D n=1 Tax=Bacillus xiapuensis TaxID=2014075 RepID=UPI0012FE1A75|nr:stage VI sporulation protein D [Bacillus xiapuensis]